MATIGVLAIAIIGAAVAAYAAYAQAEQQKKTLKQNAQMREEDARMTRLAGEAAAERQRKKDKARLDTFKSRAGAAGVVAGEGSSLLAEMDFAEDAELEAQHTRYGYTLSARGKDIQAGFLKQQAADINPEMQAGISLLSSAGSIATSYYGGGGGATAQKGGGLPTDYGQEK
jgi:hypothetical protein